MQRKNVILLGDSIGDLKMGEGVKHQSQLTIGFLNHDIENLKELYMNSFDIVITNDESFEFVNMLLNQLIKMDKLN